MLIHALEAAAALGVLGFTAMVAGLRAIARRNFSQRWRSL